MKRFAPPRTARECNPARVAEQVLLMAEKSGLVCQHESDGEDDDDAGDDGRHRGWTPRIVNHLAGAHVVCDGASERLPALCARSLWSYGARWNAS